MVKYLEVNVGDRDIYYFTYAYRNNVCIINSELIPSNSEDKVEYLRDHVFYTKETHFFASAMLTEDQKSSAAKALSQGKGEEAYNIIEQHSLVRREDV